MIYNTEDQFRKNFEIKAVNIYKAILQLKYVEECYPQVKQLSKKLEKLFKNIKINEKKQVLKK